VTPTEWKTVYRHRRYGKCADCAFFDPRKQVCTHPEAKDNNETSKGDVCDLFEDDAW